MAEVLKGRRRVLGSLALGALALGACNEPDTQINQTNIVDCENGPKTGSIEMDLVAGSVVDLDVNGGEPYRNASAELKLISDGQGGMQVDTSLTDDERLPKLIDGILNYTDSNGIIYKISSSKVNEGTSHLLVDLTCPETSPAV